MQYFTKLITIFIFMNSGISYSQRNIPKTIINQNGVFVESIISSGGNRKEGIMTFANGDKIIGEWKNDTLSSLSKIIYKDGYIEQGRWRKGVLKEKYDLLEFYEDAKINASVKQSLNNKNNGKLFNYTLNGQIISEEHYLNGKKVKEIEYENDVDKIIKVGAIKREVIYEGDLATYIYYLDNGKLTRKSSISTGLSEGWETSHNRNGVLISRSLYKNDIIISDETYFENGKLKSLNDDKLSWEINEKGEKIRDIDKINKKGFIVFDGPNDNKNLYKWVGEIDVNSNRPKGKGTLYLTNGDKIIGSYDTKNFQGGGEYYFKNGNVYKGNFKNGSFEGLGNFLYKNGDVYSGNFKNSMRDGFGKLINKDGSKFEGIWQDDKLVEQKTNTQTKTAVVQSSKKEMPRKYPVKPKTYNTNTIKKCQCCNRKFKVGTGWGSDSQEGIYNYSSSWASAKRIQGEYLIATYGLSGENDGGIDFCSKKCAGDCGDF